MHAATKNVAPAKGSRADGVSLDLTLSQAAYGMLEGLSKEFNEPIDILLRRALFLLDTFYKVRREGKHLGIASDPSAFETELVN